MSGQPRVSGEARAKLSHFANKVRRTLSSHDNRTHENRPQTPNRAQPFSEMDGSDPTNRPSTSNVVNDVVNNKTSTSTVINAANLGSAAMTTDDLLTCSICLERYQDSENSGRQPKILPCFHTFCRRCLDQMVTQQKPQTAGNRPPPANAPIRAIISCPQCRRLIAIPNGGPAQFQTNFYVLQMNELMREVGKGGSVVVAPTEEQPPEIAQAQQGQTPSPVPPTEETCSKHSKWPLLFYCRKCSQRICSNCTVLDHKEADGHIIVDLQVVMDEAIKEINDKVALAETVVQASKTLIQKGQSELSHLNMAEDAVSVRLNRIGESVAKVLAARLRKLQDAIRSDMMARRQAIRNETCDLIDSTRTLEKKRREINDKALARLPSWILDGKAQTDVDELTEMANKLEGTKLEPRCFLLFNENAMDEIEMQDICERLIPSPQRRQLPASIELRMYKATAGQIAHISTVLKDNDGKELASEEYPLNLNIVDPDAEIIKCKTTYKCESGSYNTTFLATQFGEYGAQADLGGLPLDCHDVRFTAEANEPIAIIGERGAEDQQFNKPVSVLVSTEDEALLVAEFENQRIQIFNPNTLTFKSKFSVAGESQKNYPGSIAIFNAGPYREVVCPKVTTAEGNRLSADTIQFFDLNSGVFVSSFQNKVLKKALHVAVNSCGRIIASDRDANGLFVFNREGAMLGRIGRHGSGPGQFNCPVFIACGLNDDILVADSGNNRVQILDKTGIFKAEIGASGRGRLGAPAGITVDCYGNILVADSQYNRVQMYTKDGQYLASLQPRENAFSRPRGVAAWAADGTKRVFVIDRGNHAVKTLSYM